MRNKLNSELIKQAVFGNCTAINKIIAIYKPYINTLSSRTLYDLEGNEYVGINVDLQDRLTSKLIDLIGAFKGI